MQGNRSSHPMTTRVNLLALFLLAATICRGAEVPTIPGDPYRDGFTPRPAPSYETLLLRTGDRLAICGDSITEQKRYSRIMETYLTACMPELQISVRQYGWSGETAEGFQRRMANDCLRFQPTVATTCYGMNDYRYQPYTVENARWYRDRYTAVRDAFQESGARLVLGSAGCVGKVASWVKSASGTLEDHNRHLYTLRNIAMDIAAEGDVRFADVYQPMLTGSDRARERFGADYALAGRDGVHPGWAGHLVMACVYLQALGLDGNLGTISVDLEQGTAIADRGHRVNDMVDGTIHLTSTRYPFCAEGPDNRDDSIRSGMALVPFNQALNRLRLIVNGTTAEHYRITWGATSRVYPTSALTRGINLAEDFEINPFSASFAKVDQAVATKQAFETKQVKNMFHGPEAKANMDAVVRQTETERARLVQAVGAAMVPVEHTLLIEAVAATSAVPLDASGIPSGEWDKITGTPDLVQTCKAAEFYKRGGFYCGPVAVSNSLIWLGQQKLLPSAYPSPDDQYALVKQLVTDAYLKTDQHKGTGPYSLTTGLQAFLSDIGVDAFTLQHRGWRSCPKDVHDGSALTPAWIEEQISGRHVQWLNIGWYRKEADHLFRAGGHWLTVVGYRGGTCYVLDPSPRNGIPKQVHAITLSTAPEIALRGGTKGLPDTTAGMLEIKQGFIFKSIADVCLVDSSVSLHIP